MRLLIVGGHARSGTTLLTHFCNSHPDVAVARELGCFLFLDHQRHEYARGMVSRLGRIRGRWAYAGEKDGGAGTPGRKLLRNGAFLLRHLSALPGTPAGPVSAATIEATLRRSFPRARVVGDKIPDYVFQLERLRRVEGAERVILYRDGRDVVASFLDPQRAWWADPAWRERFGTARKAAARWVEAIEAMERHADVVRALRYEDLVREPRDAARSLGRWLGVDADGFDLALPAPAAIGRHRRRLTNRQLGDVLEVAGETLGRLGYVGPDAS